MLIHLCLACGAFSIQGVNELQALLAPANRSITNQTLVSFTLRKTNYLLDTHAITCPCLHPFSLHLIPFAFALAL